MHSWFAQSGSRPCPWSASRRAALERRSLKGWIYAGPPCRRNAVQYDSGSATIGDLLGTRVPMIVGPELVFGPPQKSLKKHFRKTLGANFFGLRFKLIQTAFAAVGTRTGPVPEVTGFLGFHGMGEELREGDRRGCKRVGGGGPSACGGAQDAE